MSELIVTDDQLAAKLGASTEPIELRTPDGRRLGRFTPDRTPPEPPFDPEEMKRVIADPNTKWHTAAEVEARLRELR